nr:PREDICTED: aromatic peroxygenase-like [Bemisia tabaci]
MISLTILLVLAAADHLAGHQISTEEQSQVLHRLLRQAADARTKRQSPYIPFDKDLQRVQTDGPHKFVAPGPGDQRGPCPGLNALANHNYIPHNGIATVDQFIAGTYTVFGMGVDLAVLLAIYGAACCGNLVSWSIGGAPRGLSALGLLGQSQGLSHSHNKYEADNSPTRGDLYLYKEADDLQINQFQQLIDLANATNPNYDLSKLTPFRAQRIADSIATNPYFFYAPFISAIAGPASYTFIYRFMANRTAEHPEGILNRRVLMSFYAVSGTSGNFTYRRGWERIPDNWYRRAIGDEYTIPFYLADVAAAASQYPQFLSAGGNTGRVNTFTGIDVGNLTNGLYNLQTLLEGDNLLCYLFQTLEVAALDVAKRVVGFVVAPVRALIRRVVGYGAEGLTCPQLDGLYPSLLSSLPGYSQLRPDGSYPPRSQVVRGKGFGNATGAAVPVKYEPPSQGLERTTSQLWEFIQGSTMGAAKADGSWRDSFDEQRRFDGKRSILFSRGSG